MKNLRADVNSVNTAGQTALMAAVLQENEDMVKTLLKYVPNTDHHLSPDHYLITTLSPSINRFEASTDYCNPSGDNVFHMAAKSSNTK